MVSKIPIVYFPSWEYNLYFQNRFKLITIYLTKAVRNKPFLALKHFIFSSLQASECPCILPRKYLSWTQNNGTVISFPTTCVCLKVNSHFHWVKKCLVHFKWRGNVVFFFDINFPTSNADRVARLFESWLKVELYFNLKYFQRKNLRTQVLYSKPSYLWQSFPSKVQQT